MGREERGWLEGKRGAWDKLCAYGQDGLYKETGRGSLPGLMLYWVVRYCSMGPDSGFSRQQLRSKEGEDMGVAYPGVCLPV